MALSPPNTCTHGVINDICWKCTREKIGVLGVIREWMILKIPPFHFLWLCSVHGFWKVVSGRVQMRAAIRELQREKENAKT